MGTITLPHRPAGSDTRQIAQILADFDAILAQANGNLQASTNVAVATAVTNDGNANAAGSSSSLARADHTHMIQGVERRTGDPSSGHFVGRLYFNTTTEKIRVCLDAATPVYRDVVAIPETAPGAGSLPYADSSAAPVFTDAPSAGEALVWDGSTLSWKPVPAARVFHNAALSIANASLTALSFNSERQDTDAIHDTVTANSRLTCKTAGFYLIFGTVRWDVNSSGNRSIGIRLNGTASDPATTLANVQVNGIATNNSDMAVATGYQLAVNDYVELVVRQTSGGSLDVQSVGNHSPEFGMVRVG